MHKTHKVIISSVSNCREKNGVITFMQTLSNHESHFADHGMELTFANYVDLRSNSKWIFNEPQTNQSPQTIPLGQNLLKRLKRSIKPLITHKPLTALLLLILTLGTRGLVSALKAWRKDEPYCVHFYQDFFTAYFGYLLHHHTARRIIILHSGDDALSQLFNHFPGLVGTRYEQLIRRWFDLILRRQHAIVVLSEKYANELRKLYPAQDIHCIYNTSSFTGICSPSDKIREENERIKLIAVGSLQHRKGFDLLIKAVASMPYSEREKLAVTIVGGGPDYAKLLNLVNKNQLDHIFTLVGESDNVGAFLAQSDAYILTSRDEGLPISLIEACSYSLPIITTAVGSIPELFNNTSCKLVVPTEESIADALMSLCRRELDLVNLSLQSRQLFESKLSLEKFLGSYVSLLANKC
jgi:glycosyltransferase involved in cell wall biosynthesis